MCRNGSVVNSINSNNKKISESDITGANIELAFFDQDGNGITGKTLDAALVNQKKII